MSVGCRSLKVLVAHNFLPMQKTFILSVMTQIMSVGGFECPPNLQAWLVSVYVICTAATDGRITKGLHSLPPFHVYQHAHAYRPELQCPPSAILLLHIRQPTQSSACAQTCHCHCWLASWLSVTHWIGEEGTLNRALSQKKKHLAYRDLVPTPSLPSKQPTVLGEQRGEHCPSLFSIMNE